MCALCSAVAFSALSAAHAADVPPGSAASQPASTRESPPVPFHSGAPDEFRAHPERITKEVRKDGTRGYHLNGEGMEAVIADVDANGNIKLRCTDVSDGAKPVANTASANSDEH
jgi:hypothetical protein